MTDESLREESLAEDRVRQAVTLFDALYETLSDQAARLKAGEFTVIKDLTTSVPSMAKQAQTVDDRRNVLEAIIRRNRGVADGSALDLVAAREEVGCRLACIAATESD